MSYPSRAPSRLDDYQLAYSARAQDVLFHSSKSWETYPYSSGIGGAGDLHFFKKIDSNAVYQSIFSKGAFYDGKIPEDHVKLNIRNTLQELYPGQTPLLWSIGFAVRDILQECGIKDYISAQDRGWEASHCWATLEAIFIPHTDYEKSILPKIIATAEKTLRMLSLKEEVKDSRL